MFVCAKPSCEFLECENASLKWTDPRAQQFSSVLRCIIDQATRSLNTFYGFCIECDSMANCILVGDVESAIDEAIAVLSAELPASFKCWAWAVDM
eukprot:2579202-Pyramimonas_sp.AAC.1